MSSLIAQTPNSRDGWITPEEQLRQLALPTASTLVAEKIKIRPALTDSSIIITDCAVASIARLSSLSAERVPKLTDLAVVVLVGPLPSLPAVLTNWYKALKRLNALPKKIPPLPANIYKIMESECPIYSDQQIQDTHFLSLIPEEFGTLNRFESEILQPYGNANYRWKKNPYRWGARFSTEEIHKKHADTPFALTHWVFMSRDILPESRDRGWPQQVAQLNALSQKARVEYKIPTLQEIFTALITHEVATGESLYSLNSKPYPTYTKVKETAQDRHVVVARSNGESMIVTKASIPGPICIGIAALRTF